MAHILREGFLPSSIESIENPIIYLVGFSFVINCFELINKIKCNYFTQIVVYVKT